MDAKEAELKWLRDQKIFPAVQDSWSWPKNVVMTQIGCIVSEEQALTIKLRHKLDAQDYYHG